MATERRKKKKQRPCGEGYKRVEVDPNESDSSGAKKPSDKENTGEKKYKCVKIRKPGAKPSDPPKGPKSNPSEENPKENIKK